MSLQTAQTAGTDTLHCLIWLRACRPLAEQPSPEPGASPRAGNSAAPVSAFANGADSRHNARGDHPLRGFSQTEDIELDLEAGLPRSNPRSRQAPLFAYGCMPKNEFQVAKEQQHMSIDVFTARLRLCANCTAKYRLSAAGVLLTMQASLQLCSIMQ